jgi:type I restriction enzyme S subunit
MILSEYTMKDIYEGLYDGPHATPPAAEEGAIFLGIKNITKDGHIDFSDVKYIGEEYLPNWTKRVTPRGGDIVFSYEATLNLYAIIPDDFWGCLGRRMALIRPDENKAHGKYLYYYFFSPEWRATIAENTIIGATVDRIPIAKFPDFPISLPEISKQRKIAEILSKYDDLIENNQKQIKLLEEAAQRLYKEWFVDLRFPGYEACKTVDGVPEGWCAVPIDEAYEIKYGKTLPTSKISESGRYPVYGANGIIGYYSEKNVDEIVPLITSRGNGSGDVLRTYDEEAFITNNSFIVKGKYNYLTMPFSYEHMLCLNFKSICTGSAQPQLTNNSISTMTVIIPSENNIEKYNIIVSKWFEMIDNLKEQNKKLSESRNRLLPKLMSGEIEV